MDLEGQTESQRDRERDTHRQRQTDRRVQTLPDGDYCSARCLDFGQYMPDHIGKGMSKSQLEEQKKVVIAIGMAIKADPPARDTDSRICRDSQEASICTCPPLCDCLAELGVPAKCPISEYDWDDKGNLLCQWLRQTCAQASELKEWMTTELGDKMSVGEVQDLVDRFPWHLGPRKDVNQDDLIDE